MLRKARIIPRCMLALVICLALALCGLTGTPAKAAGSPGIPDGQTVTQTPAYQRYPAQTQAPSPGASPPVTPGETRGKYSNPYDRRVPLQGDTHKGYAPARRDPFKR